MTAANQQIVTAYEDLQLSPEEIAAEQGYDIAAVKSVLLSSSVLYRKAVKKEPELGFNDQQHQDAIAVISSIMQYSEDENLKLRAATFIRNDIKGRLDVNKNGSMTGLNINVTMMQEQMHKALERVANALKSPERSVNAIEVETSNA